MLGAFRFDGSDHLFDFKYRDQLGRHRVYNHPYDEGPYVDEIKVGDLGLPEKGVLHFLFDYGDSWQFLLQLERIDLPNPKLKLPKVIESKGKVPKQYPDSDW